VDEKDPWGPFLASAAYAIRRTFHTTLKATPGQLVFGRDMVLPIKFMADWGSIEQQSQKEVGRYNRRDGFEYWANIFIYVNDIICVHHNPGDELVRLDKYFKMKDGSIQEPTFYLGAKLKKTVMLNGVIAWSMSSSRYVNAAVQNVH
jgi:hypothetical protein